VGRLDDIPELQVSLMTLEVERTAFVHAELGRPPAMSQPQSKDGSEQADDRRHQHFEQVVVHSSTIIIIPRPHSTSAAD